MAQLEAGLVDFAGSDRPDPSGPWVQIPMTGGAIALAYNHPSCHLRLKRQKVRQIFAGTIRNYSQLGCSPRPIRVMVRSDDSGTTANLLNFLGLSPRGWHTETASGVVGNDGMATGLAQHPGGFGYLETVFLHGRSTLQAVAIENATGQFVQPTRSEVNRALDHINHPQTGYPIVGLSWVMAPQKGLGPKAAVLRQALAFGLSDQGQLEARELGYGAMPAGLLKDARDELERIQP
jgi:phosphate transport system substrate-binding protein